MKAFLAGVATSTLILGLCIEGVAENGDIATIKTIAGTLCVSATFLGAILVAQCMGFFED